MSIVYFEQVNVAWENYIFLFILYCVLNVILCVVVK